MFSSRSVLSKVALGTLAAATLAATSVPAGAQQSARGSAAAEAQAARGQAVRLGTLNCDVSAGVGLIVTSSRTMNCRFTPTRGRTEVYSGTVRRFGLDIGTTTRGRMVWTVLAPTRVRKAGALAGDYVGASGEATVGVGVGGNLLIGGFNNAVSLQPLSLQTQSGLNFATGVAQLTLAHVPQRRTQ